MTSSNPSWIKRSSGALAAIFRFARSEAAELAALALVAGGALAFVEISDDMSEADGRAFDRFVLESLHPGPELSDPIGPFWLDHAMVDLTALGSVAVLALVSIVVAGYLLIVRQPLKALALGLALGGGLLLSETLKDFFERTRPPEAYRATEALNASFPSGHALLSTVVYLVIGAMLTRVMPHRRLRYYVMGVAIFLALLIGVSRVYLGVHWASDVLAGWSLGAAWATLCWLGARYLLQRAARRSAEG